MKPVILITGSNGYIGQNLVKYLASQGKYDLIKVERSIGYDLSVRGWTKGLPDQNVDVIIHLVQSRYYHKFPVCAPDMFRVNVESTFELLEWARNHSVKRFILTSTGTVYERINRKLKEDDRCVPTSMYAATKLSSECLIQPYSIFFKIVIARLFGVYGPDQQGMLIADMINRVEKDKEISLASGVGIFLTPLFIGDCIKILSFLTACPLPNNVNIFNVAGDEVLGLNKIVAEIGRILNKNPRIKITDGKPKYLCANNNLFKKYYKCEFTPFVSGLELTLKKFLEQM